MNKDLAKAISLHTEGLHDKALHYYTKCIKHSPKCSPLLYQNYGALLRSNSKTDESLKIYNDGLRLFPGNVGITTNLANLLRDDSPTKSISLYLKVLRLRLSQNDVKKANEIVYSLLTLLSEIGCDSWAFRICIYWIKYIKVSPQMILHLASLLEEQLPASVHLSCSNLCLNLMQSFLFRKKQNCISVLLQCIWQMAILVCQTHLTNLLYHVFTKIILLILKKTIYHHCWFVELFKCAA